jgi:hypothetical protein
MPEPQAAWRNIAEQVMSHDLTVLDRQVALALHVPALLTRLPSWEFPAIATSISTGPNSVPVSTTIRFSSPVVSASNGAGHGSERPGELSITYCPFIAFIVNTSEWG